MHMNFHAYKSIMYIINFTEREGGVIKYWVVQMGMGSHKIPCGPNGEG